MMETKYVHTTDMHNLEAPSVIVPKLISLFSPNSVVDFGCGIGTFLKVFMREGVSDVLGLDGSWVNKSMLCDNIPIDKFREVDLEDVIELDKKYDLALCLEVAEHLKESCADNLVKSLTSASDLIVFSAAIPYQGGQNHVNEQWPTYWQSLFSQYGFKMVDILRRYFWNEPDVFWWYKQNLFVVGRDGSHANSIVDGIKDSFSESIYNAVHPDVYMKIIHKYENLFDDIVTGKENLRFYLGLIKRYLIGKLRGTSTLQ